MRLWKRRLRAAGADRELEPGRTLVQLGEVQRTGARRPEDVWAGNAGSGSTSTAGIVKDIRNFLRRRRKAFRRRCCRQADRSGGMGGMGGAQPHGCDDDRRSFSWMTSIRAHQETLEDRLLRFNGQHAG